MKIICTMMINLFCFPAQSQSVDTAILQFDQSTIIDTFSLENNTRVRYYFVFANTGNSPLLIENAKGSDPDFPFYYPTYPVLPGKKDSIGIILAPQQLGFAKLERTYRIVYDKGKEAVLKLRRILRQ